LRLRLGLGLGLGPRQRDALARVRQAEHPRVDAHNELHDLLALFLGWDISWCSAEHVALSFSVAVMAAILGALSVSVRSHVERGEGVGGIERPSSVVAASAAAATAEGTVVQGIHFLTVHDHNVFK